MVTFITDEDDIASPGSPDTWKQALIDAKGGNEEAVVVLGLLGDNTRADAVCNDELAEDSPRLREFAESFIHGSWGSVCTPSYNDFFEQAVSVIDVSCDAFDPVP
ncbi:MAG: hypothetical protein K0V04_42790 [Deltaproteobacteria bacterium]|nr:hypothetical protein [Deltaproteobacteria bacterium]